MSRVDYRHVCDGNRGRACEIRDRRGRTYRGRIDYTNSRGVYLRPFGGSRRGPVFLPFISIFSLGFLSGLFF